MDGPTLAAVDRTSAEGLGRRLPICWPNSETGKNRVFGLQRLWVKKPSSEAQATVRDAEEYAVDDDVVTVIGIRRLRATR